MLEFFRKYQRYLFLTITFVMIASFIFYGTFSTFDNGPARVDRVVGKMVDGSSMMASDVQNMSRFIATDAQDFLQPRGLAPNFCNNGVIRIDFLESRLADGLVKDYFDELKGDLEARLNQAKRYTSYVHPQAAFLSAKAIWDHFLPALNKEIASLQQTENSSTLFSNLSRIYLYQSQLPPEVLRRILLQHQKQFSWLTPDPKLNYEDLSLFGFHSVSDWFGRNFVDLVSQFILNVATVAEEKGYKVSLEEARGDLVRNFEDSMQKLAQAKYNPEMSLQQHLRSLGFDERNAAVVWRKVLLFRKYFQDVGEAAFVDQLPYQKVADFINEVAVVQKYGWPVSLHTAKDLAEFQFYLDAVSVKGKDRLPKSYLSADEVGKKYPQLVQSTYRGQVAAVSKAQVALRPTIKEMWNWQMDEKNWALLRKQFPHLPATKSREETFNALNQLDPQKRIAVDTWSRETMVDQNPVWVEEALAAVPMVEKTWSVIGFDKPEPHKEGMFYRTEGLTKVEEMRVLKFDEARDVLAKLVQAKDEPINKEKNPFYQMTKEALTALQKNPNDTQWLQSGNDPLVDQFKLIKQEKEVPRTQEGWMKEQAFMLNAGHWSPVHVADDGQVVFFYLEERKITPAPILDQLSFGKETLSADAKRFASEKILKTIKTKNAIMIPMQKEDNNESI